MKKQLLSLLFATALLASCGTTTHTSTSTNAAFAPPANIQTTFTTQYPDATNVTWTQYDAAIVPIDWEMTGWNTLDADDYAVSYTMGGHNYYSWYDANGNWIGTTYSISDYSRVPADVHTLIRNRYAGYTIVDVDAEMWQGRTAYEVKLKNGDNKIKLLVDPQGNVLKEKLKD